MIAFSNAAIVVTSNFI